MVNGQLPSQDILDGVRHIAGWNLWFSAKVGQEMEDERRRSYLADKLRPIMSELEIEVSHKETRKILGGKYKLTYIVAHRGANTKYVIVPWTDSTLFLGFTKRIEDSHIFW